MTQHDISKMDDRIRRGFLFDFYGELLNEHQKEIYEAYVYQDLSFGEIAEEQGVSRQSVFDLIKRCSKTLEDYEQRLHLMERFLKAKATAEEIQTLAQQIKEEDQKSDSRLDEILRLTNLVIDEI